LVGVSALPQGRDEKENDQPNTVSVQHLAPDLQFYSPARGRQNSSGYLGRLRLASDGSVEASNPALPDLYCFARCDTRQDSSYQSDGLNLNTYRICSPLNKLTANTRMTDHQFLTSDRAAERSRFGDVVITVNYGSASYSAENAVLPRYGFLVESPRMVAFRANAYGGRAFSETTMLVVTSSDGKPIATSREVDTYRA
jgi:hypothetical protein